MPIDVEAIKSRIASNAIGPAADAACELDRRDLADEVERLQLAFSLSEAQAAVANGQVTVLCADVERLAAQAEQCLSEAIDATHKLREAKTVASVALEALAAVAAMAPHAEDGLAQRADRLIEATALARIALTTCGTPAAEPEAEQG